MKRVLLFFMLASCTAMAQITITNADITAQYTPGNSTTIHTDTLTQSVDIGQMGSTSWDFSGLTSHVTFPITVVDPASTPYHANFPGSNLGAFSQTNFAGVMADTYSYLSVNGSLNWHGTFTDTELFGLPTTIETSVNPVETVAVFPFTYNSNFNYNGERTIETNTQGFPPFITVTTVVSSTTVDAYGPMTLPGGYVVDALRIKEDEINLIQGPFPIYSRSISYTFIAKDGSQLSVPSDTTQPMTGVITNSASISWNGPLVSSVQQISGLPQDYSLEQNYPNPFNPITNIEYSIPEASFVELKIYDVLGNEVATLVNQEQNAGVYRADFSGSDLASGLYIARITAGNYTNTIKMSLLK